MHRKLAFLLSFLSTMDIAIESTTINTMTTEQADQNQVLFLIRWWSDNGVVSRSWMCLGKRGDAEILFGESLPEGIYKGNGIILSAETLKIDIDACNQYVSQCDEMNDIYISDVEMFYLERATAEFEYIISECINIYFNCDYLGQSLLIKFE